MQRVCKDDGKILLLEHGRSKAYEGLTKYLDANAERHAKNWGCIFNRDIDALMEEAGLDIESLTTWHFGTTYYVVAKPKSKESGASRANTKAPGVVATSGLLTIDADQVKCNNAIYIFYGWILIIMCKNNHCATAAVAMEAAGSFKSR